MPDDTEDRLTVAGLIAYLQQQPQDLLVIYRCCSEYDLLHTRDIRIVEACAPRADDWVQRKRPDMPSQPYLLLPGN
jgi:hypothetical protein